VYGTFDAWDSDRSGSLSRAEFSRISQGTMSELFIGRVFEEHVAQHRKDVWPPPPPSPEGKLHLKNTAGELAAACWVPAGRCCKQQCCCMMQPDGDNSALAAATRIHPLLCAILEQSPKPLLQAWQLSAVLIRLCCKQVAFTLCCMSQVPPAAAPAPAPAAHWGPSHPWRPHAQEQPLGPTAAVAGRPVASRVMRWT
jgi:hypothetical protein